ncbi:FliI/YscN family ATPase [Thalassobius sp. I31.1]|uniref:FliI/YscN family ATPase n=1 Tax=Thalassobius sp. I31.1 TaxID=2109912 RepID=UPI000D1B147F|nr:FliI/YscN family ATPase [Thalassobius sp. I31.1]
MTETVKTRPEHKAGLRNLLAEFATLRATQPVGRITEVSGNTLSVKGLSYKAGLGDQVSIHCSSGIVSGGEVLQLNRETLTIMPDQNLEGVAIGDEVILTGQNTIAPDNSWIGHVIDPFGRAIDGSFLMRGVNEYPLRGKPPLATERRGFGERLETGTAVFNTLLPIVRGQRIGLFAGSGVGKSTLLAKLARNVQADIVVIALIGERGREVREFVENVLGPEGMARAVVVAATSDQSPLVRRQCALTAMSVAENFRDQGQHVLLLADSITRFAEAHREIALASGEPASLRGFPPSTSHMIMSLCERAGPGGENGGDITGVFSVLVAGSDMDEPIADILRGVLDGHVVLDRQIAERGRFPAVDLLRSVSRSLPGAASDAENALITRARRLLGAYDRAEMMIQAGLYLAGSDPVVDAAIRVWPGLDRFLSEDDMGCCADSFTRLEQVLAAEEGA